MDALCFPVDAPPVMAGAHWFIGWEGQAPADEKQAEARAASAQGGADYEAYVATLKGRASISINSTNLEKK